MSIDEASCVPARQLHRYRKLSHGELRRLLDEPEQLAISGPSGTNYQLEIEAVWDGRRGGDLRIIGAIDDGSGRCASFPLTDDFILSPDGSFVGE